MISSRSPGGLAAVRLTTVGSGYTGTPNITVSGGGGTGASVVAYMAGTRVRNVVVVNGGTGYTSDPTVTIEGNAAAVAHAFTGQLRPMKFLRSRQGILVGVDGMGRGIRWDGRAASASPVGLLPPLYSPSLTSSTAESKYIAAIEVFESGSGYSSPPVVTISGGSPSTPAEARANVSNGRVVSIEVTEPGKGYQSPPSIALSGGNASGATLSVGVVGYVEAFEIVDAGSGYTSTPTVTFATSNGLTEAAAYATTDGDRVTSVVVTARGTGATDVPGVTIGGNAVIKPITRFSVQSVTVVSGGQGFLNDASVAFTPAPLDVDSRAAAATAKADGGSLQSVTVISGGLYSLPPTATIEGLDAKASPRLSSTLLGEYACAIRYLAEDDKGVKVPSSISDIKKIDAGQGAASISWTLSHGTLDDRVTHVELWRSTGDQEILLYRVATIPRDQFPGTYTDSLSDSDLIDVERDGYGLLPVTLPSGQINARRFGVPPGNFASAVMFQDRAWYAVDTTGQSPNSLLFSEVDEPESVPTTNELILQESVGDSDEIVTLVPLASSLLAIQRRHIYKIQYVAQPVIDASVMLSAYRGILNQNCVDVMGGVAFIADSHGMYAYDGSGIQPISVPVDDYWRDGKIDFSKSEKFFIKCDDGEMVARFFYCDSSSQEPVTALCYSVTTKAWWTERFAVGMRSGGNQISGNVHEVLYGTSTGELATPAGHADGGTPIDYSLQTGNFAFTRDGSRAIGVLYTPTASTASLSLKLHYNGSPQSRDNAVSVDRGGPFTADATGGVLDMRSSQSHLGDSVGYAKARYSGRGNDQSTGGDRHIAVRLSGSQSTAGQEAEVHAITIEGVG